MTENTVTLSPELAENLQKLAQAAQLSVDELAETVLKSYVQEQETLDVPGNIEIAEVNASIVRAKQPGAKWYSDEEVAEIFENYTPAKPRRTIKNSGQA